MSRNRETVPRDEDEWEEEDATERNDEWPDAARERVRRMAEEGLFPPIALDGEAMGILRDSFLRATAEMLRGFAAVAELEADPRRRARRRRRDSSAGRNGRADRNAWTDADTRVERVDLGNGD